MPPHGESGRLAQVGVIGFFCGPVGVGVLLRSWVDTLGLCVVFVITGTLISPAMFAALCGGWAVGRVLWRDKHARQEGAALSQPSPEPVETA